MTPHQKGNRLLIYIAIALAIQVICSLASMICWIRL